MSALFMNKSSDDWNKLKHLVDLSAENARLKAEVERLKMEESKLLTLCETYEGDLKRLRKAGDALYESKIGYYGEQILEDMKHHSGELCRNWNAAKEGKQP